MLLTSPRPVVTHESEFANCYLFGDIPPLHRHPEHKSEILHLAEALGGNRKRTTFLMPASTPADRGYKRIWQKSTTTNSGPTTLPCDGCVVSLAGDTIVMPTGDCANLMLDGLFATGLGHCGREALRPNTGDKPGVAASLLTAVARGRKGDSLRAFITGSICPDCFPHETASGQRCIADFLDTYGEDVFEGDPAEGKLHLPRIIRLQLLLGGVSASSFVHDDLCTREHPSLASYRNGDTHRNVAIVIRKTDAPSV